MLPTRFVIEPKNSFAIALIIITCGAACFMIRERQKKAEAFQKYQINVSSLAFAQTEIVKMRSQEHDSIRLIQNKEKQISILQAEINEFRKKEQERQDSVETRLLAAEKRLKNSRHYHRLQLMANKGQQVTDDDWQWIYALTIKCLPNFWDFISANEFALNENEFNTCILIRLHVHPISISEMLNLTTGYITKLRSQLHKKVFGTQGTSKDFDKKIQKYT